MSNCKKKYYFLSHCSKYLNLSHLLGDCFGLASLCLLVSPLWSQSEFQSNIVLTFSLIYLDLPLLQVVFRPSVKVMVKVNMKTSLKVMAMAMALTS